MWPRFQRWTSSSTKIGYGTATLLHPDFNAGHQILDQIGYGTAYDLSPHPAPDVLCLTDREQCHKFTTPLICTQSARAKARRFLVGNMWGYHCPVRRLLIPIEVSANVWWALTHGLLLRAADMQISLGGAFNDTKTLSENLVQIICFISIMGRWDFQEQVFDSVLREYVCTQKLIPLSCARANS